MSGQVASILESAGLHRCPHSSMTFCGCGEGQCPLGPPEDEDETYGEGECTCRRIGLGGNDPDAGWRIDQGCPEHGEDR